MFSNDFLYNTFSILGYDPAALEWGVAVESKAFIVGGIVPWARAGVGAVATQSWTNKSFGPRGLQLLKRGHDPKDVIQHLIESDPGGARRQLAVMDAKGRAANYTGDECSPWAGGVAEQNVSVQGNILTGEKVVTAMLRAFKQTQGKLADRLVTALEAGQHAGGDRRGQQSAALLVVREKSDINGVGDVYVDLRVDDHKTPIAELRRLYGIWERERYAKTEGSRIHALMRSKKYARAQQLHRSFVAQAARLVKQNPDDAVLLDSLAWQLAQDRLGLDAALKYAQRAAKLKPRDADIADTLAEVHYLRGDAARAVEIERGLVERNPDREEFGKQLAKFERAARAAAK